MSRVKSNTVFLEQLVGFEFNFDFEYLNLFEFRIESSFNGHLLGLSISSLSTNLPTAELFTTVAFPNRSSPSLSPSSVSTVSRRRRQPFTVAADWSQITGQPFTVAVAFAFSYARPLPHRRSPWVLFSPLMYCSFSQILDHGCLYAVISWRIVSTGLINCLKGKFRSLL